MARDGQRQAGLKTAMPLPQNWDGIPAAPQSSIRRRWWCAPESTDTWAPRTSGRGRSSVGASQETVTRRTPCLTSPPAHSRATAAGCDSPPKRRNPERADAASLVEDLGDMPACFQHGDPERVVLDRRGSASVKARRHACGGCIGIHPRTDRLTTGGRAFHRVERLLAVDRRHQLCRDGQCFASRDGRRARICSCRPRHQSVRCRLPGLARRSRI